MKNKSIYSIILFISTLLIYSSCNNDNPVISKQIPIHIDTNSKYNWSFEITTGIFNGYCVADSSNIFFACMPYPLLFNGTSFMTLEMKDSYFISYCTACYNINTVYFGGYLNYNDKQFPVVKKWEQGNITNYNIPNDSNSIIIDIIVEDYDKLWVTNNKNQAYLIESGTINSFSLDSGVSNGTFFKSPSNQIYLFKTRYDSLRNVLYIYNYLFNNTVFEKISIDSTCYGIGCTTNAGFCRCGSDIMIGGQDNSFYWFNGYKWGRLNIMPPDSTRIGYIGGKSKDDFVFIDDIYLYIFRDNKWSLENSILHNLPLYGTCNHLPRIWNDRVYLVRINLDLFYSTLYIGKLKN